jgi:hypothetical protein
VILLVGLLPARSILIIEWGTPIFSELYDSYGNELYSSYTWELGAFNPSFTPTATNVEQWSANWWIFDRAAYNPTNGFVIGNVIMNNDGTSANTNSYVTNANYQGLDAYIWGYNKKEYEFGLEWVWFRHGGTNTNAWTFATLPPDDPPTLEVEWSISDLIASDVPLWGSQLGVIGLGYASNPGIYDLQTYTIVPEPAGIAAGVLLVVGTGFYHWRRKRRQGELTPP